MIHILIADDEIDILNSIREMLSPFYKVDIASTGLEVLQLCESKSFDALIIDVDFGPGVSGIETASLVRKLNKNIKILIFSAVDYSNAIRQQAVDIGAAFYEKPLSIDLIRQTIEEQTYDS